MKHSAALKVKVGDLLAADLERNGILYEVIYISFPIFMIKESFTAATCKRNYLYLHKPTNAQLNAYNKRKEKYYECKDHTIST